MNTTLHTIATLAATLLALGGPNAEATAQQRYVDPVFASAQIDVTADVKYGRNVDFLPRIFQGGAPVPIDQYVDVYAPAAAVDAATDRPAVVLLHQGAYLPTYLASCWGSKADPYVQRQAMRLAELGYVVFVPSLRLGWSPFSSSTLGYYNSVSNASFRQYIDAKTLNRFIRRDVAEAGNTFGVDPDKVVIWGLADGSGAVALTAAYLHEAEDFNTLPFFIQDDETQEIVNVFDARLYGDFEGATTAVDPETGDTLNIANHVGYENTFALAVTGDPVAPDTAFLTGDDAQDPPLITFVNPATNPGAEYQTPITLRVDPSKLVTKLFVAEAFAERAATQGLNDVWDGYTFGDEVAGESYRASLTPALGRLQGFRSVGGPGGNAWPWVTFDYETCAAARSEAAEASGAVLPGQSLALAEAAMDTILRYFAPRACVTLGLDCGGAALVSTREVRTDVDVALAPNPSAGRFRVAVPAGEVLRGVEVYDLAGARRLTLAASGSGALDVTADLPTGAYVVRVLLERGAAVRRLIVR